MLTDTCCRYRSLTEDGKNEVDFDKRIIRPSKRVEHKNIQTTSGLSQTSSVSKQTLNGKDQEEINDIYD